MDRFRLPGLWAALSVGLYCCVGLPESAWGAPPRLPVKPGPGIGVARDAQGSGEGDDEPVEGVFLPPDRTARRRLDLAREMLDSGHYGEAVRFLGSVLESPEDYFLRPVPEPSSDVLKVDDAAIQQRLKELEQTNRELEGKTEDQAKEQRKRIAGMIKFLSDTDRRLKDLEQTYRQLPEEADHRARQQRKQQIVSEIVQIVAVLRKLKIEVPVGQSSEVNRDAVAHSVADRSLYHSLKAEAGRVMGQMPAEARESYELQFGARARQMLNEAVAAGDITSVAEVSRRFFVTKAGFEATALLGRYQLDHNQPLAAALCFQRLYDTPAAVKRLEPMLSLSLAACWVRASMPEKAQDVLVHLKHTWRGNEVMIGGQPVKLFASDAQALAWFTEKTGPQQRSVKSEVEQWVMYRGDPARNAPSSGGRPLLQLRWRQRTIDDRAVENLLAPLRRVYLEQEVVALPSMHPLAMGNVVVMRTATSLQAIDFASGKLIWRYPSSDESPDEGFRPANSQQPLNATAQVVTGIDQRMWDDAIYGTLSSDGERVFYVEDLSLTPALAANMRMVLMANGQRVGGPNGARATNRLAARELRTEGKLKWQVGGPTGEDEPKLAGAFFLGPGLPMLGRVYALAEIKGQEIRLVVLSAETGRLEWSQQLTIVEQTPTDDQFAIRRMAGATPSFADGVLVCPTAAGAVVGLDLTSRSLLWGYQYTRSLPGNSGMDRMQAARLGMYPGAERRANDRWLDDMAVLVDGRVLVTPVDSDHLYCLNLVTGELLWKWYRGSSLYLACVHGDKVVLVGHDGVVALNLADGKPAWNEELMLPAGSVPSGRGFYAGDHYYLPLTSAEVILIDLQTGRIDGRSKSRTGDIPGNLICFHGNVISQSVDYLDAFYQIDALKELIATTLKEHPNDPKSLARLGEIKLDEGALPDAIRLFRRSYELNKDDTVRDLLVQSLLEGLKSDFAGNRGTAEELEGLIDQPQQRAAYLRLLAAGLQAAGETLPAFEAYLKLSDQEVNAAALDELDESHSVERDRWLRTKFAQLRDAARSKDRLKIDDVVAARLAAAQSSKSTEPLRKYLEIFGEYPSADQARESLVVRLSGSDTLLEREHLLRRLEKSRDAARSRAATARLAALLVEAGRPELAVQYYRQLAARLSNVVCVDGKTGRQLVDDLPPESPVRNLLSSQKPWPEGKVVTLPKSTNRALPNARMPRATDVEFQGPTAPFFDGINLALDAPQQQLLAEDGLGRRQFSIALNDQGPRRSPRATWFPTNPLLYYVSVNGNLLVLSMGNQILAADTLRNGDSMPTRVLWSHDLMEQVPGIPPMNQGFTPRQVPVIWSDIPRLIAQDSSGRPIGSIGPVNFDGLCFQQARDVVCVHPLTGKQIWSRKNVPLRCDLFGDDELLFAVPPDGSAAWVLRAADGEVLGKREVPTIESRMTTLGRLVLSWKVVGPEHVLSLTDPWEQKVHWSRKFSNKVRAALVGQEAVGTLEPNGHFTLLSLPDGKVLADEQLEAEPTLLSIYLMRFEDRYLLITNGRPQNAPPNVTFLPVLQGSTNPLVSGRMYGFDGRTGKKLWSTPAEINQYGVPLNQPSELPVLVCMRQVHQTAPPGQHEPKISVLCIDKRTGRVVYENNEISGIASNNYELLGDRAASTVSLMLPTRTVALRLTDEPLPPIAKTAPPPAPKKGVWSALRKAVGDAVEDLRGEIPMLPPTKDE